MQQLVLVVCTSCTHMCCLDALTVCDASGLLQGIQMAHSMPFEIEMVTQLELYRLCNQQHEPVGIPA